MAYIEQTQRFFLKALHHFVCLFKKIWVCACRYTHFFHYFTVDIFFGVQMDENSKIMTQKVIEKHYTTTRFSMYTHYL